MSLGFARKAGKQVGAVAVALLALTAMAGGLGLSAVPAGAANQWSPVHPGDFPDPDVLFYGGTYYGFATQNFAAPDATINIQVSTSTDGVNWSSSSLDALPSLPSWARAGNTWAPSVAYNGSEFVMYYAATRASDGDQCIGQAISSTPLGPYRDTSSAPFLCQDNGNVNGVDDNYGGSIDPDIFIDTNGSAYLIWKSDGNHLSPPIQTYIWGQPLSTNLLSLSGTAVPLLQNDNAWQSGVVEGPDMVNEGGTYYLFYSASDEGTAAYGIGYAVCPAGPTAACQDESSGPLLGSQSGMSGPGGPSVFALPADASSPGQLHMAFAAWEGTTIGYLGCGIRPMYLATLVFNPNGSGPAVPFLAPATLTSASTSPGCAPPTTPPGYWQVASDGGIFTFGNAQFYGSTGSLRLNQPVVGMAATPDGKGYWLVASDGGIFAFGDANFYGSTGSIRLNKPIVGMISTITGRGYWLVASDGGIFAFGDATFYGSLGGRTLDSPVTAMAPGYLGGGYLLVDADGQVFAFGDANYEGQPDGAPGGYRITGMATSGDDKGYWLASANGNIASEGDAASYGSMIGTTLDSPIVGMSTTPGGGGYWLQGGDGGIFCFGNAAFLGSMGGKHLNAPMVGIASA